ncbi:MAG: HPF/RaiA family ribosome-associated protein [Gemmatimonadota bacterium]
MQVRMTARQCEVPEEAKQRAESRLLKLQRFEPRLSSGELVFTEERHVRRVEAVLSVDGAEPVIAKGEATEFVDAVDRLSERLNRTLRRRRGAKTEHRSRGDGQG